MNYLLSDKQRIEFINAVGRRYGCYYTWPDKSNNYSGKDLEGAQFEHVYDCSGLVTCALYDATAGILDRRSTWNAQRLMRNCVKIEPMDVQPGDLCFYGSSPKSCTHVMVYIGKTPYRHNDCPSSNVVVGSSGGGSKTLTPQIAASIDAKVKGYDSHLYRKDFLAFGRLVTSDE